MSDGLFGLIFAGFVLGVQYRFLYEMSPKSFFIASALFAPILISRSGVSSFSINSTKRSYVT